MHALCQFLAARMIIMHLLHVLCSVAIMHAEDPDLLIAELYT